MIVTKQTLLFIHSSHHDIMYVRISLTQQKSAGAEITDKNKYKKKNKKKNGRPILVNGNKIKSKAIRCSIMCIMIVSQCGCVYMVFSTYYTTNKLNRCQYYYFFYPENVAWFGFVSFWYKD